MPVFAKLSKAFYDKLGEEVVNELVDWLNAVDARFREDYYDRLRLYNSWTHLEARQRHLFPGARRSATHMAALGQLYALLDAHARLFRIGSALITPSNFERDPYDLAQLDLCVLAARDGKPAREWTGPEPPLLAVEIVSSKAPADRSKRLFHQHRGVGEYWIADLDARAIERWRPSFERPELRADVIVWQPADADGLHIDLVAMFARIHGESF